MKTNTAHIIVAGGGVAGMEAAGTLAGMGYRVTIVEKGDEPGGHLLKWHALFPDRRPAEEVKDYLRKHIENRNINIITGTTVEKIRHHGGGVLVNLSGGTEEKADAVIVATGFDLFDARNLAVISIILVVGLGGNYGFPGGMIPFFGAQLPALSTAAIFGIVLNALLNIGSKSKKKAE